MPIRAPSESLLASVGKCSVVRYGCYARHLSWFLLTRPYSGLIVVILLILLFFLHLRRKKRDEREWGKDPQELEDYGIGPEVLGHRKGVQAPIPAHRPGGGGGKHYGSSDDDFDNLPDNKPVSSTHDLAAQLAQRGRDDTYGSAAQVPRPLV
jgi:hypothetical protein